MRVLENKLGVCTNCKLRRGLCVTKRQVRLLDETKREDYKGPILCLGWGLKDENSI